MRPSTSIFIFLELDRDEELFDKRPLVVKRHMGIQPDGLPEYRMDDAIQVILPAGGCQFEINEKASLLPNGVTKEF